MGRIDRPDPPQQAFPWLWMTGNASNVGCMSGRPMQEVRAAWFLPINARAVAHWYDVAREDSGALRLRRLCDGRLHWPGGLFEPGNFPSCKHCRRMIDK